MGDYKCNSGIPADKSRDTAEDNNIYNSNEGSRNYAENNIPDSNTAAPGYSKNKITDTDNVKPGYSQNNITDSTSADDNMDGSSDCGCDTSDSVEFPDDDPSAIIYSETVVFTEPFDYDSADARTNTSDLVEDEQEGSEFITPDSSRPQC